MRKPIADPHRLVYQSPDPQRIYAYSPGIATLRSGRLVTTLDIGAKGAPLEGGFAPGAGSGAAGGGAFSRLAKIYTSDDRGTTFQHRTDAPMLHGRPFEAGSSVYFLGHARDLCILRSTDNGNSWSRPSFLTSGRVFHQAPCNVHYAGGRVYLVMEEVTDPTFPGWPVHVLAPVVLSARVDDDLTKPQAWSFSNALAFRDVVKIAGPPELIGAPFFQPGRTASGKDPRNMAPPGWLETHVVQFRSPGHVWHDASGHVFYLWLRAHTGLANWACIARVEESSDGSKLTVLPARAPSGETMLYVPCPGGHLKFHIVWDEQAQLFWLVSNQSTDSMRRPDDLPSERHNLPANERHRIVLHYSANCVDWQFAGIVADSGAARQARSYPAASILGDDLCVVCRSGNDAAHSAHDGNWITFHTVRNFRRLIA